MAIPLARVSRSVPIVGRGAAVGALLVTAICAAYAAESLHTGQRVVDWSLGLGLLAIPLLAIGIGFRVATGVLAWLLLRLRGRIGGRINLLFGLVVSGLHSVARPWVAILVGLVMIWAIPADSPLTLYQGLTFFELVIGAGAIVGALIGLGLAIPDEGSVGGVGLVGPVGRRRRVAGAVLVSASILGVATTGWALTPGQGDPIVRESSRALETIPVLDLPDPSAPGPYAVVAASYGSGLDRRREEYGVGVDWVTPTVDASAALVGRGDVPQMYADWFWGFDNAHLPLNALAWYPADAPGRRPVVLIAHGNHEAGDFSDPGYAYLGEHLASRGYIAASVDQNFLNGDAFFDYGGAEMGMRAWLLLRHLEQFRTWDATPGHPLAGRVDLERVALIGHSRGGESAALAAAVEHDPSSRLPGVAEIPRGFGISAVIALAPSDGMYVGPGARPSLRDVDYLVMQGAHDGDLPGFSGLLTYHRVDLGTDGHHLKVALFSARANHGRFNSVWDDGDAGPLASWMLDRGSILSPADQQRLAKAAVTAFLARSLEGRTAYDAFFREPRAGRAWLPDDIVETHWQSSSRIVVDDMATRVGDDDLRTFSGFDRAVRADPMLRDGVPQSDRAVALTWSRESTYTVSVEPTAAVAIDPHGTLVLSLLISADDLTASDPTIELRAADGETAAIRLGAVSPERPLLPARLWKLDGLGDRYLPTERQVIPAERFLQTHEIPLSVFTTGPAAMDISELRSVTIRFEGTGSVFLDDVGFEPAVRTDGAH